MEWGSICECILCLGTIHEVLTLPKAPLTSLYLGVTGARCEVRSSALNSGLPQGQKVSRSEDERLCPAPPELGSRYQSLKCQVDPDVTVAGPTPRGSAW